VRELKQHVRKIEAAMSKAGALKEPG